MADYALPVVNESGRRVAQRSSHNAEVNRVVEDEASARFAAINDEASIRWAQDQLIAYTLGGIEDRTALIATLPLVQIGARLLQIEEMTFDLRPLRGYWSDTNLPWIVGGYFDDLFTISEIETITVTEWSFDLRPVRGYVTATGEPWPEISGGSAAMPEMQVHVTSPTLIHIYIHQAGTAYVRWEMKHDTVPARNADVWRIGAGHHVNRIGGAYIVEQEIAFNGETDVAIWFHQSIGGANKPDHIGGQLHGNEELIYAHILLNGAELDLGTVAVYNCETFEVIQASRMFEPGNTEPTVWSPKGPHIMTHYKHLSIGPDGWWHQDSRIDHIVGGFEVENAYFGMLCMGWGSRGYNSVHTAAREPQWAAEDVSIPDFTEIESTAEYLKAWGDDYAGEVKILKGWTGTGRNIRVDNRPDRRKIYSDYYEGDVTSTSVPWEISMQYRISVKG